MNYQQLVELYFERSNALQWYWTLYVVIVGGLLAFVSLRRGWSRGDVLATVLITVLFGVFAYRNLGAIEDVTRQREAVVQAIKVVESRSEGTGAINGLIDPTLISPDYRVARRFHLVGDVLTIAALWAMHRRRRLGEKAQAE